MPQLDANGLSEQQFLEQYEPGKYPRPSVTVDIVIFTVADAQGDNYRKLPEKELRVLLIRRGGHPFIGQWALPGGFVQPDETVGEAASRELAEETGMPGGPLEQLYTFSKPGRDPRTWVISCAHMALVDSGRVHLKAGSDADDARWFTVKAEGTPERTRLVLSNEGTQLSAVIASRPGEAEPQVLENSGLAFDHAEIIMCALERLRAKLEHTDLAFGLLPEKFTLTELQQVYEVILGRLLYKAAFRRKMGSHVAETGEFSQSAGHRPSQMFTHRKGQGQ